MPSPSLAAAAFAFSAAGKRYGSAPTLSSDQWSCQCRRIRRPRPAYPSFLGTSSSSSDQQYPSYVRYTWSLTKNLKQDPSLLADTLLELGAAMATVALPGPLDVTTDASFAKTGRVNLQANESSATATSSVIEFWMMEYGEDTNIDLEAKSLAQEAALACCLGWDDTNTLGEIQRIEHDDVDDDAAANQESFGTTTVSSVSENKLVLNGQELSIISSLEDEEDVWAFGDGCHTSTTLSLAGVEDFANDWHSEHPFTLLDMGCGTGILTLAGLALGAGKRVTAVDISHDALLLTRENLKRNSIVVNVEVEILKSLSNRDASWEGSYDAVVANIPSNTLILLLPMLSKAVRVGGRVMTAGYPSSELDEVSEAAEKCSLKEDEERRSYDSGWVLQVFIHDGS